jgi:hypothetical protein
MPETKRTTTTTANDSRAEPASILNSERIGKAAGAIWGKLHSRGKEGVTLADLKKASGFTADEALAGIGWLAREGKLCFEPQGRKFVVKLVEEEIYA